jgi:hypothetical protein
MNRRSFLRRAGAAALAVVAAPLFIPAERLDFGVPRPLAPPAPQLVLPPASAHVGLDMATLMADLSRGPQDWATPYPHRYLGMPVAHKYDLPEFLSTTIKQERIGVSTLPPMSGLDRETMRKQAAEIAARINAQFDRAFFDAMVGGDYWPPPDAWAGMGDIVDLPDLSRAERQALYRQEFPPQEPELRSRRFDWGKGEGARA